MERVRPSVAANVASHARRNALENIVTHSRASVLLIVVDEDAAYVVGYPADIRGLQVNTDLQRIPKATIALRIQVSQYLKGNPDTLQYSHRKADNS